MKSYQPQLPIPFDTDWHHQFGPQLAVFPRNLSFREGESTQHYWPDLATFIDDVETAQLAYYPESPSPFSLFVIYRKLDAQWQTLKFCDDLVLQRCAGGSFDDVMEQTVTSGLSPGEA
jgi:hypothetical protein